jgi:hypothetical protein
VSISPSINGADVSSNACISGRSAGGPSTPNTLPARKKLEVIVIKPHRRALIFIFKLDPAQDLLFLDMVFI